MMYYFINVLMILLLNMSLTCSGSSDVMSPCMTSTSLPHCFHASWVLHIRPDQAELRITSQIRPYINQTELNSLHHGCGFILLITASNGAHQPPGRSN